MFRFAASVVKNPHTRTLTAIRPQEETSRGTPGSWPQRLGVPGPRGSEAQRDSGDQRDSSMQLRAAYNSKLNYIGPYYRLPSEICVAPFGNTIRMTLGIQTNNIRIHHFKLFSLQWGKSTRSENFLALTVRGKSGGYGWPVVGLLVPHQTVHALSSAENSPSCCSVNFLQL